MRKLIFIISVVVMMFLVGCSSRQLTSLLKDVESYIMELPDSALAVLESVDRELLTTDQLKAHHALLYAMALDKNFIDVDDDSLASVALSYYSRKGPDMYEARALYYLGLSYYYAGDYNKAILEFTKAEKVAEESDSLYLGFIKVAQAATYRNTHIDSESLACLKSAYDIYSKLSLEYYINVSELEIAKAYFNNQETEKSDSLLSKLILSETIDKRIYITALQNKAFLMASRQDPDYHKSVELYDKLLNEADLVSMTSKDYWAYAYALANVGRNKESQSIISRLSQTDSSATAYYWQYKSEKLNGDFRQALSLLEKSVTDNNKDVTEVLKQSLVHTQKNYFESLSEMYEYKERAKTLALICVIAVSILLISSCIFFIFRYMHLKEEEKERYIQYADEISRQLEASKNEDYPVLKRKYMELYRSKFETIGYLYEQYALSCGKKNADKILSDKVKLILNEFKGSFDDNRTFEDIINRDMDNIVQKLRNEVNDLKEIDYKIFSLTLVGFDVTTISHLLDMSINAVHVRRTRMRKQIENINPIHKIEFIETLSSKVIPIEKGNII